jgi:PPOX class probable F420-dependent enzyme
MGRPATARFERPSSIRRLGDVPRIATAERVDRDALLDFVRPRHRWTLVTTRREGAAQVSPVTGGATADGRLLIATYPDRAKAVNLRRSPGATVLVHSDDWDGPYVQIDGVAEVFDMPAKETEDGLVEYFRCAAEADHPDWDEYRSAMRRQGKSLIRITISRWGPIATGGFPPDRAPF